MEKIIKLHNRYGNNYWLEAVNETTYAIKHEGPDFPIYVHSHEGKTTAVDWDGAEMMCVGQMIGEQTISEIILPGEENNKTILFKIK